MHYDRFALLETEQAEAQLCKRMLPFRDWHIVKPEVGEAIIVDSKRKAQAQAKKHAPMIEAQRPGSASPTGLAHNHSGEEDSMTIYTVSISENNVWAGSGQRDENGAIECAAVLRAAEDDAQDEVYEPIQDAVTAAIAAGETRTECEVNGYHYTMQIVAEEHCECGALTGERCQWTGPITETVIAEYMPEYLRASHIAAGNRGIYPHNGARRIRVEKSCADRITHVWADGAQTDELDEWVRRVS